MLLSVLTAYIDWLSSALGSVTQLAGRLSTALCTTGGTLVKVLEDIIGRGAVPSMIRVVTVVCAPTALQKLSADFPGTYLCHLWDDHSQYAQDAE